MTQQDEEFILTDEDREDHLPDNLGEMLIENIMKGYHKEQKVGPKFEGRIIHVLAPWGELIATYFSAEQWEMLHQVAEMAEEELDEVIVQTVAERYKLNKEINGEEPE